MATPIPFLRESKYFSNNSICNSKYEERKFTYFEKINFNNLNNYYTKDESVFKKKVDKLNIRFFLENDKFTALKSDIEKSEDNLFVILFKQISVYIQEIERLNIKLKERKESERTSKMDEVLKFELSFYSLIRLLKERT
jgi:hypothetical protein